MLGNFAATHINLDGIALGGTPQVTFREQTVREQRKEDEFREREQLIP